MLRGIFEVEINFFGLETDFGGSKVILSFKNGFEVDLKAQIKNSI